VRPPSSRYFYLMENGTAKNGNGVTREEVLATVDLGWDGPIRTPSLEVANVAWGLSCRA
jgi:hypothetical protein